MDRIVIIKIMKINILTIIVILFALCSCEEKTIGYLDTENIGYSVDSIVFKAILNPDYEDDARQLKLQMPFSTGEIQGVQGTLPITYMIREIDCSNEDVKRNAVQQFHIIGKGRIQLAFNHTLPIGRYIINLRIENEGHYVDADSVLTIIIR